MLRLDGPRLPPAAGGKPGKLIILAHGYGSNGDDLIGLAPYLARLLPDAVFVAPNAPDEVPGYGGGYQWFPITRLDPAEMARGVALAAPMLDSFIDQEMTRYRLPASAVSLIGFSQGTMMALHVGLRRKERLAAIVGYSGLLAAPPEGRVLNPPPVALIHGDLDEMIPVQGLISSVATLGDHGVPAMWSICPELGHSIDEHGLRVGADHLLAAYRGQLKAWTPPEQKPL
jgi:phospholipase/carboxylesterase